MSNTRDRTPILAVFCDFENIALGVRDAKFKRFEIRRVLERLLLKGSIVVKKAYCDWDRYKAFKPPMHEAAFELIEIPHVRQSGKNSADIRMVVDALDLCYTKSHVNTFVIISGDSDFSPLVSKLRENDKAVIGVGVANSSSDLLIANCDEFIYYDDLVRTEVAPKRTSPRRAASTDTAEAAPGTAETAAPTPDPADDTAGPTPRRRSSRRGSRGKTSRGPVTDVATENGTADGADAHGVGPEAPVTGPPDPTDKATKGLDLVCETVAALADELGEEQKIWGSMVKQTLRRRRPGFNESFHGFRSFNAMLEEAQQRGLLLLEKDDKSGGYIVRLPEGLAARPLRDHEPDDADDSDPVDDEAYPQAEHDPDPDAETEPAPAADPPEPAAPVFEDPDVDTDPNERNFNR